MNTPTAFQKFRSVIFGAKPASGPLDNDSTDAVDTEQLVDPAKIKAYRAGRQLNRTEVAPDALQRAIEEFISKEVQPYVKLYPQARYQIDQIVTPMTPENRPYLSDIANFRRKMRNGIATTCIGNADGAGKVLDWSRFIDWNIGAAANGNIDDESVYTVLAGTGTDPVLLDFIIYGDYVEIEEHHADTDDTDDPADAIDTVEPIGCTDPLLALRIRQPGKPERQQHLAQLPIMIGRGSQCALRVDSPYVSRVHALIRYNEQGEMILEANSDKGTSLTTHGIIRHLARGEQVALSDTGVVTLSGASVDGAVEIEFEQCSADARATLETINPPRAPIAASGNPAVPVNYLGAAAASSAGAGPTVVTEPPALARLQVRHADGSQEERLIYELPFMIGREPTSPNGMTLRDPRSLCSRDHLRIEKLQGGAFVTDNFAFGKGGTWSKGEAMAARFVWRPEKPGGSSGWHVLGNRGDTNGAVMVRLEQVPA